MSLFARLEAMLAKMLPTTIFAIFHFVRDVGFDVALSG